MDYVKLFVISVLSLCICAKKGSEVTLPLRDLCSRLLFIYLEQIPRHASPFSRHAIFVASRESYPSFQYSPQIAVVFPPGGDFYDVYVL